LKEAARLGQADAHLRLATLYNAAGLKSEAALGIRRVPQEETGLSERKELDRYIAEQKKP
jgi:hypothetical protein